MAPAIRASNFPAETAEAWQERVYLDMQEFREWQTDRMQELGSTVELAVAT